MIFHLALSSFGPDWLHRCSIHTARCCKMLAHSADTMHAQHFCFCLHGRKKAPGRRPSLRLPTSTKSGNRGLF